MQSRIFKEGETVGWFPEFRGDPKGENCFELKRIFSVKEKDGVSIYD